MTASHMQILLPIFLGLLCATVFFGGLWLTVSPLNPSWPRYLLSFFVRFIFVACTIYFILPQKISAAALFLSTFVLIRTGIIKLLKKKTSHEHYTR